MEKKTQGFKDKTLLITGGTGSFGQTVLKHFLTSDIGQIRIFSRDEKKQDDMRHELQAKYPDLWRCQRSAIHCRRYARSGLYIPCGCFETGTIMRIFPDAGGKDKCRRY